MSRRKKSACESASSTKPVSEHLFAASDANTACHFGHQDSHVISDAFWVDVVIQVTRYFQRTGVQARLMSKGRQSGIGLMGVGGQIRDIGDRMRDPDSFSEVSGRKQWDTEFQFQVCCNGK